MNKTPIEWVRTYQPDGSWTPGYTVNPIRARWKDGRNGGRGFHFCQKISPGCKNCYASRFQRRFGGLPFDDTAKAALDAGEIEIYLDQKVIEKVLRFRRTAACFPFDMTDLFQEGVPDEMIDTWFAVMARTPHVNYRLLTKRAERMFGYLSLDDAFGGRRMAVLRRAHGICNPSGIKWAYKCAEQFKWPLPNVWLGVSAESQRYADERIPWLLKTPAAVRFLSHEPALGPIDLNCIRQCVAGDSVETVSALHSIEWPNKGSDHERIDWIISGGESGPGARPAHPEWFRSIRRQCTAAGVPFFFKQWGEFRPVGCADLITDDLQAALLTANIERTVRVWPDGTVDNGDKARPDGGAYFMEPVGKKAAGRLLDGEEWNQFPVAR